MASKPQWSPLAPELWTLKQPLSFCGTQVGTQSTLIRLSDGHLWMHSPGPYVPATYKQLRKLGEVQSLVAPNPLHHMFVPKALTLFPQAQAYGTPRHLKKHPQVTWEMLTQNSTQDWSQDIDLTYLEGLRLGEWVFFHKASKTLILTDLLFNMRGKDLFTRLMLQAEGVSGKLGCTRLVSHLLLKDRQKIRQVCERILAWDFERMVMCHGETVETEAKAQFAHAMAWTGL